LPQARRCPYPRSGLGGCGGNRSKMGVSPTSSEVPSHFPGRGGRSPSSGGVAVKDRCEIISCRADPSTLPCPSFTGATVQPNRRCRKKFRGDHIGDPASPAGSSLTVTGEGVPPTHFLMRAACGAPDPAMAAQPARQLPGIDPIDHEARSSLRLWAVFGPCCLMDNGDNPSHLHAREGSLPEKAARRIEEAIGGAYGMGASKKTSAR